MKPEPFAALGLCALMFLSACSTLDLKGSGERWRDSQRRAECYKQYRTLCPELDDADPTEIGKK